MNNCQVIQFARAPEAGQVKTRLQPALGIEQTLLCYQWLMKRVVENCHNPNYWDYQIQVAGNLQNPLLQQLANDFSLTLRTQVEGNLGDRMLDAVRQSREDYDQVILIGSDCPLLDKHYLQQALDRLQDGNNVVLGPAEDGGYVLLGCVDVCPQLFADIDWGSDQVLMQTRLAIKQSGLQWAELPTLWDIDRPEDLQRLQNLDVIEYCWN